MAKEKAVAEILDGKVYILQPGTPVYLKTADVCRMTGKSNQWIGQLTAQGTLTKDQTARGALYEMRKTVADYLEIQRRAAEAIREIDPDTTLMVESNYWDCAASYKDLIALEMPNVIYQFHSYAPGAFTHQGVFSDKTVVEYPGVIGGEYWDLERLKKEFQYVRAFQLRHNARIYVGEFSAIAWAPHPENYLQDCITLFEEYGWDYTYHAFREWSGWSIEHEADEEHNLHPSEDNPRKQVILKALKKNKMFRY